jgi:hypothetical protein
MDQVRDTIYDRVLRREAAASHGGVQSSARDGNTEVGVCSEQRENIPSRFDMEYIMIKSEVSTTAIGRWRVSVPVLRGLRWGVPA